MVMICNPKLNYFVINSSMISFFKFIESKVLLEQDAPPGGPPAGGPPPGGPPAGGAPPGAGGAGPSPMPMPPGGGAPSMGGGGSPGGAGGQGPSKKLKAVNLWDVLQDMLDPESKESDQKPKEDDKPESKEGEDKEQSPDQALPDSSGSAFGLAEPAAGMDMSIGSSPAGSTAPSGPAFPGMS